MSETPASHSRAGWEHIIQHQAFPPRYQTLAAPNKSVEAWAETIPAGSRIVDIGCGVGRHAVYLGERGFEIAGMDLSPTGVQKTQEACAERQIAFDGRVADMTALPWEDATFDAALSTSVVCHHRHAHMVKTIGEIWRVLKPGGLFLVDFLHKHTLSYQRVREQAAAGQISEVEPNTFVDESPEPDKMNDAFLPHHYCDEEEVRELLRAFEIIRLEAEFLNAPADGGLSQRGYWVAWVRKPAASHS